MRANSFTNTQVVGRLSLLFLLIAVAFVTRAERLPIKTYTVADGLPQNGINQISQDASGFFWFCTNGGLARFDGYGFTNFTVQEGLPSDTIFDFQYTREGDYWLATAGGLVKFTPDGTIFNRIVLADEVAELADASPPLFTTYLLPNAKSKSVSKLLQDSRGRVWVGAGGELFQLDKANDQFKAQLFVLNESSSAAGVDYIYSLYEDRRGAIWVGTGNRLHRILADGRVTSYASAEASPVYFRAVLEDRNGNIWVGTAMKGLYQFAIDEQETPRLMRHLTPDEDTEIEWINSIVESFDGKLWIGVAGGFFEFDQAAGKFYRYTRRSGIGTRRFQAAFEDRNGNLWLGTRSNGALRLSRRGLTSFGLEDGISFVRSVSASGDGSLLLTGFLANHEFDRRGARVPINPAEKGAEPYVWHVGRFDETGLKWQRPNLPPAVDYFGWGDNQLSFQARNGEWWIATGEGLFRYPPVKFEKLPATPPLSVFNEANGLSPHDIFRLYEDSRGDVFISSTNEKRNAFYKWERANETLHDLTPTTGLPFKGNFISAFAEDRTGTLWLGFYHGGLARLSQGTAKFFKESNGLPQGGIFGIFVDRDGKIWLASRLDGVARIDAPEAEQPNFIKFTTADGLSSNRTFAITQDGQGLMYIATDRDINRLNPATGAVKILKLSDEQPPREFRSAVRDASGVLWFGTTEGLVKYTPLPETASHPPEILLTGIEIEGQRQKVSAVGAIELNLPTLAPGQNQVRIDFTSLAALDDEEVSYQYKIEPSADWSPPIRERFVNLVGLSAGSYKIQLRAVASDGTASERVAVVSFKILPPIYQRAWFLALAAMVAAAAIYGIYRYRVARLLEVANMRTRIATDLHDDIGANLTKIAILSEVARQQFAAGSDSEGNGSSGNGGASTASPLVAISRISRESVSAMGDIVWAINPERDRLLDLVRRMRQHAEEIFTRRDIRLDFHAPEHEQQLRIGVDVRRDLFLVFKEATNNAARHSGCTRVQIGFRAEGQWLLLRIADNGAGFDAASESEGQGLASMRRRALALGGALAVESRAGQGTSISLKVPRARFRRAATVASA